MAKEQLPPGSPNLIPMDYFVWGYLEAHTNRCHTTKASLIASIKEHFTSMPSNLVIKACSRFRGRIVAVIKADGNFIEWSESWDTVKFNKLYLKYISWKLTFLCHFYCFERSGDNFIYTPCSPTLPLFLLSKLCSVTSWTREPLLPLLLISGR